jgi:8-oxo-dGTP diphosphatase
MRTRTQTSAGGAAFRDIDGVEHLALIRTPEDRWQLPKGVIDTGETPQEAALREVREEAGITCELIAPIRTIEYWFVDRRSGEPERIHKFVHFFLMRYISGDVADHDDEVLEARWVPFEKAIEMLEFDSEKSVAIVGADMLKQSDLGSAGAMKNA